MGRVGDVEGGGHSDRNVLLELLAVGLPPPKHINYQPLYHHGDQFPRRAAKEGGLRHLADVAARRGQAVGGNISLTVYLADDAVNAGKSGP